MPPQINQPRAYFTHQAVQTMGSTAVRGLAAELNLFSYGLENPLKYFDQFGMEAVECKWALKGITTDVQDIYGEGLLYWVVVDRIFTYTAHCHILGECCPKDTCSVVIEIEHRDGDPIFPTAPGPGDAAIQIGNSISDSIDHARRKKLAKEFCESLPKPKKK